MFAITIFSIILSIGAVATVGYIFHGINEHFSVPDHSLNPATATPQHMVPQSAPKVEGSTIRRLKTLREHQLALQQAFQMARERLVIVSPFVSAGAVIADRVEDLTQAAVARGVQVLIYVDRDLNTNEATGVEHQQAREGRMMLQRAGAQVITVNRVHSKTLIVDDNLVIDGSFNWLSALRSPTHRHQRHETSMLLSGSAARDMIQDELRTLLLRAV